MNVAIKRRAPDAEEWEVWEGERRVGIVWKNRNDWAFRTDGEGPVRACWGGMLTRAAAIANLLLTAHEEAKRQAGP